MAIALRDIVDHKIEHLVAKQNIVMRTLKRFITNLEINEFYVGKVTSTAIVELNHLSIDAQRVNTELDKYVLFRPDLLESIDSTDNLVESIADRFWKWTKRTTLSTSEAMKMFGKSRSTIYRWIQSGKLQAKKEGYRWVIAV